ncbi:phage portal protein [Fibrisoma montanum]|uniref:Phage portal protein n=1 Tax=Fibrisoma montanum TaxID=2305895 RepID=A0A418M3K9_9BACT|nr:phage portal protein [Fibrisoma montanum]RIV20321.1 phage portal protein [Fibrisoma montanum]
MSILGNLWASFWSTGTPTDTVPRGLSLSTETYDPSIARLMGLNEGKVAVTEENVLGLSAVYACVDRISKSIASLPWDVYDQPDERTSRKAYEHPVFKLLHTQPHPLYSSSTFRRVMLNHLLLRGNFYAEIQRDGRNRPIALKILKPGDVTPYLYNDQLFYQLTDGRVLMDYEVFHLKGYSTDGLVGRSPIRVARDAFAASLESQRFGTQFMQNGARPAGILLHSGKPSPESKQNLKESWQSQYSGDGIGKTATLTDGWTYTKLGIDPQDAQWIDSKKLSRAEICGIFGVPPHMVMDLDKATFSNIENQNIWYVAHTLTPYLIEMEQEANRKLFRDSESGRYTNKLNVKGLLRGDTAAQTAHLSALVDRGIMSRNEARALDELNPYEGGDEYLVQGAMVPADLLRDFYNKKINDGSVPGTTARAVTPKHYG